MSTSFDVWEARTRIALAGRGVDHLTADPLVEEARQHWLSTGSAPEEALGSPRQFASDAAAQLPVSVGIDRQGVRPGGHLSGALFALLVLAVPWSLAAAVVTGTWAVAITPASTVATGLFAGVFVAVFGLPDALRAAGRPRTAPLGLVVALLLALAVLVAAPLLPTTPRVDVPVLVLAAASLLASGLTTRGGRADRRRSVLRGDRSEESAEAWSARLRGLLVGRHDVPPVRAAELVAEAEAHAGGEHPGREFGAAEEYAAALGAALPERRGPVWLRWPRHVYFVALCLVLLGPHVVGRDDAGTVWLAAVAAVLAVAVPVTLATVLIARRRHRGTTGADGPQQDRPTSAGQGRG